MIAEGRSIKSELERISASRRPSKAGVGVFAKLVAPSGYKQLTKQVGSIWVDSSVQTQMQKVENQEQGWAEKVTGFLGTVQSLPMGDQHAATSRQLQSRFRKTRAYVRSVSRLNRGIAFLDDLKSAELSSAAEIVEPPHRTGNLRWADRMAEAWFDGDLEARKADIIRILRGIPEASTIRATLVENLTAGTRVTSRIAGTLMTVSPIDIDPPLVGRVESLERRNQNTYVTLSTGIYEAPNLFFVAGDFKSGQDALRRILRTDVRGFLKITDPYVSPATLDLLEATPSGTEIRLLSSRTEDLPGVKKKVAELLVKGYNIELRQGKKDEMHGRYLITDGAAWMIDHSLKDFGKKDCGAARLQQPFRDLEVTFDNRWSLAPVL